MIKRWIYQTLCMLLAATLGAWLGQEIGLILGLLVGGWLWLLQDTLVLGRLLRWLRSEQVLESLTHIPAPALGTGIWAEVVERMQRLLKKRDQTCLESQKRLDEFLAAIQDSPNGVVLLDAHSRIEWCNQTAAEHFGLDAKRDLYQHISNLVRDPAFTAYLSDRCAQDVVVVGARNTSSCPVRLSVQLHTYGQGKKLLLSRDITALEQAEAMRRDFVANVSHEIRTPLTVLAGFIETLQTLPLQADERAKYLNLMAQQSTRLQTLVQDLLLLSKLEASPNPSLTRALRVQALFSQCEQEAHALSAVLGHGHVLWFDPGPPCELLGSESELFSALFNLVSNALRYTPAGGRIEVTWELHADGQGQLAVQDQGPGIDAEHLPRLTERFYRIDSSRSRATGGTGLGLAIVKHVAQRHGAQLHISSQPAQGTRFVLVFPANRVRPRALALLQP